MVSFRKTMAAICEEVAFNYEIDTDDIRGPSRVRVFAWPRQEFMARALDAGFSSGQIGMFLSGRDHSSVLVGAKRHRIRMAKRKNHAA
jgi:chromosomal replication initiation ATPase DnaA